MVSINPQLLLMNESYLFQEITERKIKYQKEHPDQKVISFGVGDTTEPISPHILEGLVEGAKELGNVATYHGYADVPDPKLIEEIIDFYDGLIEPKEVLITSGAKENLTILQVFFGANHPVVIQDPSFPAYIDDAIMVGTVKNHSDIITLPGDKSNNYLGDLSVIPDGAIIYFCSPNNPTGYAYTNEQLQNLIDYANEHKCVIIYDAVYSAFIRDGSSPKNIYQLPGAKSCVIEIQSFSKLAGFTGVRLGWTIMPKEIKFDSGQELNDIYRRMYSNSFNGASIISQKGGIAALDPIGQQEIKERTDFYLENASIIRKSLEGLGLNVDGGINSPYLWVDFRPNKSWDMFDKFLNDYQIVTTPGFGFGPMGEGFLRFASFGHRADIIEGCDRLKTWSQ